MQQFEADKEVTIANRGRLLQNRNLLYWYEQLYHSIFINPENQKNRNILEIGSGTSPLKIFYDQIKTSDILQLDYLDYSFDSHEINRVKSIPDESLDVITLTNVIHHLKNPDLFLKNASRKLKKGGVIILTEPYFSTISTPIYKYLHHEPAIFDIDRPELDEIEGPLTSSNQAIPYLIFFSDRGWDVSVRQLYAFGKKDVSYFTSISYFATGGISSRIWIPFIVFKLLFTLDNLLARVFPKTFASFFTLRLTRM